jgi:hypothetical protein
MLRLLMMDLGLQSGPTRGEGDREADGRRGAAAAISACRVGRREGRERTDSVRFLTTYAEWAGPSVRWRT